MDDLELLHDDHSLLNSQVAHVTALIGTLERDTGLVSSLEAEILRQMEILRHQLIEHFAFEEEQAFPSLAQKFPHAGAKLQALREQHSEVLEAFDAVWTLLPPAPGPLPPDVLVRFDSFGVLLSEHAADEAELLRQLAEASK